MSAQNGWHPWLRPMQMRESSNSAARTWLQRLQTSPLSVNWLSVAMLLALALSQAGCAVTSSASSNPAANPSPPPTTLSEHSQTYSEAALLLIQNWRSKLTALIPKPAN